MNTGAIYIGKVVHKRLQPVQHELEYHVASLLVDLAELEQGQLPALVSYNRFNLFSLHDCDHGDPGSGQSISEFAWGHVRAAGLADDVRSILMLAYPRMLGYAFNPLTTYYALDAAGHVRLVLFEVHNTFGGRHVYVSGPHLPGQVAYTHVDKTFRVSPFNGIEGTYGLRATPPGDQLAVGVNLSTTDGPILKAYFTGKRHPLTSATVLRILFTLPLMTLKVVAGIHWEALKLWLKGLKLQAP